jgi:hypothetical protein
MTAGRPDLALSLVDAAVEFSAVTTVSRSVCKPHAERLREMIGGGAPE